MEKLWSCQWHNTPLYMAEIIWNNTRVCIQGKDILFIEDRTTKFFFTTHSKILFFFFFYGAILPSNWVQSILLGLSMYLIMIYHASWMSSAKNPWFFSKPCHCFWWNPIKFFWKIQVVMLGVYKLLLDTVPIWLKASKVLSGCNHQHALSCHPGRQEV